MERLRSDRLGQQQVVGRVQVELEAGRAARRTRPRRLRRATHGAARLSPPKAGSMTPGGSSRRAFVPRPWRSGASATTGRAVRAAASAAASSAATSAAVIPGRSPGRISRRPARPASASRASWSAGLRPRERWAMGRGAGLDAGRRAHRDPARPRRRSSTPGAPRAASIVRRSSSSTSSRRSSASSTAPRRDFAPSRARTGTTTAVRWRGREESCDGSDGRRCTVRC